MSTEIESLKFELVLKDILREEKKFTTLKSLSDFIEKEREFWQAEIGGLTNYQPMSKLLGSINTAKQEIVNFKTNFNKWQEPTRQQQLNGMLANVQQNVANIAFFNTPFAVAFVEACKIGPLQAHALWIVVATRNNGQLPNNSVPYLEGAILGYEFLYQDESLIYKRRDSERRAFSALRKTLSDQTDEIVGQIDDFRSQIEEWKNASQQDLATDRASYKSEQNEFLTASAEKLETQLGKDKGDREVFFANAKKQIEDLEALYREKLRLEPAASYGSIPCFCNVT